MGSSRDAILRALRAAVPQAESPLPDLSALGVSFPDLRAQFAASLASVGGRCVEVPAGTPLEPALLQLPEYASATRVASRVPGVARANVELAGIADPHQLADVDFCVLPGELAVAENGAVWVTDHGGANRAVAFLTQHLALVVPAAALVHDLHEAYARIRVPIPGFGLWLSGPSKTADIEQALVIGAHGARSCTVLLVD